MVKRFASHLEAIEWLKQNALESEEISEPKITNRLAHRCKIILVEQKAKGFKRSIRYCQRCGASWPCLVAQEEAIERGKRRRWVGK